MGKTYVATITRTVTVVIEGAKSESEARSIANMIDVDKEPAWSEIKIEQAKAVSASSKVVTLH